MTEKQINKLEWNRTKKGVCYNIFNDQKHNSKTRGHRLPDYTRDELREWLMSQKIFHELFNEWVQSKYSRKLRPSVDRLNDDVHYCFSNIQIMTFRENERKFQEEVIKCNVIHKVNPQRKVKQYDKDMNFIAEYNSMQEAKRVTGCSQGNISMVCAGIRKTTRGFKWRYSED